MYDLIFEILTPYLGFYISNNRRSPAISKSFAINQEVYGLEAVVGDSSRDTRLFKSNCKISTFTTQIYLTQHEGGSYSIDDAVLDLENLGWATSTKWVTVSRQENVKRAVMSITSNCLCR